MASYVAPEGMLWTSPSMTELANEDEKNQLSFWSFFSREVLDIVVSIDSSPELPWFSACWIRAMLWVMKINKIISHFTRNEVVDRSSVIFRWISIANNFIFYFCSFKVKKLLPEFLFRTQSSINTKSQIHSAMTPRQSSKHSKIRPKSEFSANLLAQSPPLPKMKPP